MRFFTPILGLILLGCQGENITGSQSIEHEELLNRTNRLIPLHEKLPAARPGDWLYEREEKGQTFGQYTKLEPVAPYEGKDKIYLLPIGIFDQTEALVISKTAEYITAFFGLEVVLLRSISDSVIPDDAKRLNDGTLQLHTKYILDKILLTDFPTDAIVYTAITNVDLYPKDSWNFVFGQAYLTKKVGVSSMFRYKTANMSVENHTKCLMRLAKTATHELTHMFSVKHCIVYRCLMNGSNSLPESDRKPLWLCPDCLLKLSWCTGYSITERFDNLIRLDSVNQFTATRQFLKNSKQKITD